MGFSSSVILPVFTGGGAGEAARRVPVRTSLRNEAVHFPLCLYGRRPGTRSIEVSIKVLSAAGVDELGQITTGYNSENERIKIDYVRVIKPGGEVVRTSADKAPEVSLMISPSAPMYSDYREKHISVAGLVPGATLEYKVTTQVTAPLAPHEFWLSHSFNKDEVQDEQLIIEVPKKSQVHLKSARYKYTTQETGHTRIYEWKTSHSVRAEPRKAAQEEEEAASEEDVPDVQLSTFANWQAVAKWYDELQRERLVVTPEIRSQAAALTKGALSDEDKARRLYNFVSLSIRYVSVSFGVGRMQPHAAGDVLHNQYGDCKDKPTLLAAMLKSVGISSDAVLIDSSHELDADVPSPSQFDHVITVAQVGAKRVWLDSTAEVAPFGLLMPALRGKKALLVAPESQDPIVEVPVEPAVADRLNTEVDGKFNEAGDLEATFKSSLEGDGATVFRSGLRRTPQGQWKDLVQNFSYYAGFMGDVSDVKIEDLEAIDKPLRITYHYSRKEYFAADDEHSRLARNKMPLGPVEQITRNNISSLKKHDQLMVGGPLHVSQKARLQFIKSQHPKSPIPISLSRDYGSYQSTYVITGDEMVAERTFTLNSATVAAARTDDVAAFMAAITKDTEQPVVVMLSRDVVANQLKDLPLPENVEIQARMDAQDFAGAIKIGEKRLAADPHAKFLLNTLGAAYLANKDFLQAEAAFRKQIKRNPYDAFAYTNLALALDAQGRFDEAIKAYGKQIEIVPLSVYAHLNLGLLLMRRERCGEAIPELEKALQISPEDLSALSTLNFCYRSTGKIEQSRALLPRVTASFQKSREDTIDPSDFSNIPDEDPADTVRKARERLVTMAGLSLRNPDPTGDRLGTLPLIISRAWFDIGRSELKLGDLEKAEAYLKSAWMMSQAGAVGNSLGQVYEKQHKVAEAIEAYAEAIAAGGPKDELRARIASLVRDEGKIDAAIQNGQFELLRQRSVWVNRLAMEPDSSQEIIIVFKHSPHPDDVIFLTGESELKAKFATILKSKDYPVSYPDENSIRITRMATLFCGKSGCSVALKPLPTLSVAPPE